MWTLAAATSRPWCRASCRARAAVRPPDRPLWRVTRPSRRSPFGVYGVERPINQLTRETGVAAEVTGARQVVRKRSTVDGEAGEALAQPCRRRPDRDKQLAQWPPLGVPRTGRALVLLHHRGEQGGHKTGRLRRARARRHCGDRVAFVRHGG